MKLLIIAEERTDLSDVLEKTVNSKITDFAGCENADVKDYDAYCVISNGKLLSPLFREKLEEEVKLGKLILTVALPSFLDIYSASAISTTRSRLVCVDDGIEGFDVGDIIDDECNLTDQPYWLPSGAKPLFVYKTHLIAHRHTSSARDDIMKDSKHGIWMCGDNVMMTSFRIADFNKARFAPRESWKKLITYVTEWLTGASPAFYPSPICTYDREKTVLETAARGTEWLKRFLVSDGKSGIREGLRHEVTHSGKQMIADAIRTDCSGEASGAFGFIARVNNDREAFEISRRLKDFVFGPMQIKGGIFDGMLRWTDSAWSVCYPDDAARAMIPTLMENYLFGENVHEAELKKALDFLLKLTSADGTPKARFDCLNSNEETLTSLSNAANGYPSAHYSAYCHASLLLGFLCFGNEKYLDAAKRGLETLMSLYPDTKREQSETEEECRLVFPLALLYGITKDEKHLDYLERVTADITSHRHPNGGICEWDTGYKASCSRESTGECSVLTENGDPVADLLYSINWLPMGFAWAYHVTKDEKYDLLWKDIASFFTKVQTKSEDVLLDGCWNRAFDLELCEPYAAPHDVGWGPLASETGWTDSEIIMGLLLPEVIKKSAK